MTEPPIMYGVWIPGLGWLRIESRVFADSHQQIARQVAKRIGKGAQVYFIDSSIATLERQMLETEYNQWSKRLWRTLINWKPFKRK